MKNLLFLLAFLLVFPAVYAKDKENKFDPNIQQVFVSFEDTPPNFILIRGDGFLKHCEEPTVMIQGLLNPLLVVESFDDEILAELPGIEDGNYGLTVTCKNKSDSFDFAIGAIGPVGPEGPQGDQGPIGFTGADGKDGADGLSGFVLRQSRSSICYVFESPVGQLPADCPKEIDTRNEDGIGDTYWNGTEATDYFCDYECRQEYWLFIPDPRGPDCEGHTVSNPKRRPLCLSYKD